MVQIVGESVVVRKQRRAWRRVIGLLAGLVFAGIAVVLVARQVGSEAWLWPFIIALTPWLLIPAAAGLVLAIVARSWVAFAGLTITGLLVLSILVLIAAYGVLAASSGITAFGIGGAFWGLVAGLVVHIAERALLGRT